MNNDQWLNSLTISEKSDFFCGEEITKLFALAMAYADQQIEKDPFGCDYEASAKLFFQKWLSQTRPYVGRLENRILN